MRRLPGVVSWSSVKGATYIKTTELKAAAIAAGIDVTPFETKGEPSDRFQVTLSGPPPV